VDGVLHELSDSIALDKNKRHTVEIVVDRLVVGDGLEPARVANSVDTALKLADGVVAVAVQEKESSPSVGSKQARELVFSQRFACAYCGISMGELEPRSFSFNSPHGACPECTGLGFRLDVDPDLVIPNKDLTLAEGAVQPWVRSGSSSAWYASLLESLARAHSFSTRVPVRQLSDEVLDLILYGNQSRAFTMRHRTHQGKTYAWETTRDGC
jgi:excinuclease ABC subunit A